ncbi:hypothetical protein BH11PLA2_BH11PLA2_32870 [soil metagenome]
MSKFSSELKRLRAEKGLTQKGLAEKIGVSQPFIAQLETGIRAGVTVETLYALSDLLGVSADHWRPFLGATPAESKRPSGPPVGTRSPEKRTRYPTRSR